MEDGLMARVQSEYEVESLFIERLTDMGYKFIPMKNYGDRGHGCH